MTARGHEDQFLPLRLSARSVIRKQTVAATRGNGRDAPIPAVRGTTIELPESLRLLGRLPSERAVSLRYDDVKHAASRATRCLFEHELPAPMSKSCPTSDLVNF
jgi:hypothetical protein